MDKARIKCMHCLVEFHDEEEFVDDVDDVDGVWRISYYRCPKCLRANMFLNHISKSRTLERRPIRPVGYTRPCPEEVSEELAEDFREASTVLPFSPKASAALSRRCFQNLLREKAGVKPGTLANEIKQVLDSNNLPTFLAEQVDAIRNVGNFSAHPTKSINTGELLPVEVGEAEWNLDILDSLFDFYFVLPARIAEKRAALDAKLNAAGKPPMK